MDEKWTLYKEGSETELFTVLVHELGKFGSILQLVTEL